MGLILDTSALICLEREPELWHTGNIARDEQVIIPAIVWAEALSGVRLASSAQKAARRMARLESMRRISGILPFSDTIAEHYADIFSELYRKGCLIPQNDLQVAATARAMNFDVLVGKKDEAHFRKVEGLGIKVL